MADPFAAALAALHRAAGSVAAVYTPPGGEPISLRVIQTRPDRLSRFADAQVLPASNVIVIRALDVAHPVVGAMVALEDYVFTISLEPVGDAEGLSWSCGAEMIA